jgi:hypothetical protein
MIAPDAFHISDIYFLHFCSAPNYTGMSPIKYTMNNTLQASEIDDEFWALIGPKSKSPPSISPIVHLEWNIPERTSTLFFDNPNGGPETGITYFAPCHT